MKTLFIGGVKSGKSSLAEAYTLSLCSNPIYLATSEIFDEEMKAKVKAHQDSRSGKFITIEEPLNLVTALTNSKECVLIECMTLWLNNMLYYKKSDEEIRLHVEQLLSLDNNMVFILNDVGSGIIGADFESRKFVNLSGILSQQLAKDCDEVYHVIAGISRKIK